MNSLFPYYSFYLFLFFSFSFGTYLTSCSNGTLNPAYSRSWHTLPTAYSPFPILFRFAPQRVFRYWLAFYLVTFRSTYVINVLFYYIVHMYLLRFPSQVLVNTPSSLTHLSSTSIDRRPISLRVVGWQAFGYSKMLLTLALGFLPYPCPPSLILFVGCTMTKSTHRPFITSMATFPLPKHTMTKRSNKSQVPPPLASMNLGLR